jgi:N-hydroxyarylamine O-acetyltransferase
VDIQTYLDRIRLPQAETPNYPFLARLQQYHMQSVPFENLDVVSGREIVLEKTHLYHKVVADRRGGFCYELNGLFGELLRSLGFTVIRVSARVYKADGTPGPDFDHMALLVSLDRTYLVDVGFGDSALTPLPVPDGRLKDISGRYRLIPGEEQRLILQRHYPEGWRPEYDFTRVARVLDDYRPMCDYHQTSPDSSFTQRAVCTRATETGRLTLSPAALTITKNGRKRKLPVLSAQAYYALLEEHFDISLPPSQQAKIRLGELR